MNNDSRIRRFTRRSALIALLLVAAFSVEGCTWWEKNVSKRIENIASRGLTITTDPPGADVFVNDVFQGKSPLTLNYDFGVKDFINGFVVVVQRKGYLPVRREASTQTDNLFFRLIRKKRRR